MFHRFVQTVFFVFIFGASSAWGGEDYLIASVEANLRSAPHSQSEVISTLLRDTRVTEIATQGNWLNVRVANGYEEGWVFRSVLREPVARVLPPPEVEPQSGQYWLLAIAINEYQNWPKLRTAVNDARDVVKILVRDYGFAADRVITLYDEDATIDNIMSTFQKLKSQVQAEDSVLIYYAGHGVLDEFNSGSWIPVNARENRLGDYITTDRINRVIASLTAKHIFLVADACYSGTLLTTRGREAPQDEFTESYFLERIARASRQALTSGGIEEVLDDGRDGHSVFAYHFLNELNRNTLPYFAASSLSSQVEELVLRNADQRPHWDRLRNTGDENGEFFFLRRGLTTRTGPMLTLRSEPADATIIIEGEVMGRGEVHLPLKGVTQPVEVAVERAGYNRLSQAIAVTPGKAQTVSLSLNPDANTISDIRTVTDRLNTMIAALQKRNEAELATVATLSPASVPVWAKLRQFARIDAELQNIRVSPERATATIRMVELQEGSGDTVIPGGHWQTQLLTVTKTDQQWGKIEW